jgi:sodium pump decarboxylase gamma subunit
MTELIEAGLTVTLLGMSVVFVLLTALVGIVQGMSHVIGRFDAGAASSEPPPTAVADGADDEIVGVISSVISMYRSSRQKPK